MDWAEDDGGVVCGLYRCGFDGSRFNALHKQAGLLGGFPTLAEAKARCKEHYDDRLSFVRHLAGRLEHTLESVRDVSEDAAQELAKQVCNQLLKATNVEDLGGCLLCSM